MQWDKVNLISVDVTLVYIAYYENNYYTHCNIIWRISFILNHSGTPISRTIKICWWFQYNYFSSQQQRFKNLTTVSTVLVSK